MRRRAKPGKWTLIICAGCGRKAKTPHHQKLLAAGWKATLRGFTCAGCATRAGTHGR